jgi:tetratricopeptide (TPR) repeat protein
MKANLLFKISLFAFSLILFSSQRSFSQNQLTIPQVSQHASVMQTIGLTDIKIDYHRPGVKGREIWGKLVPYNQVWRAGANQNTTISFSDPVMIEGKNLPSGTYGLHMIPAENEWTIIFSRNNWSWGSFFYDEKEDALRVAVKPQSSEFQEWLVYTMDNPSNNSVDVNLRWANLKVGFKVTVDLNQVVIDHFKKELDNLQGFSWQAWNQAAYYAFQNNVDMNEALSWSDKSIGINKNGLNLWTKALLLEKTGSTSDVDKLKTEALSIATENEVNMIGYQYLFNKQTDEAINIFKKNTKLHPESWNVYDSLGEALNAKGEKKEAIENYEKALKMVKDNNNKQRITRILENLKNS